MKLIATCGDGSLDEKFLSIWLNDPKLLNLEFSEIVA
jgi:hypothetical protein